MAYPALISLEDTINRILNHDRFSITLEEKRRIKSLLEHVNSFQGSLEEFPDKFNSLEGRMRELTHEAEDILEYLVLGKVSSSSVDPHELQLERVMGEMDLIAREVEKIEFSSSSKDVRRGAHSSSRSSSPSASASAPQVHDDAIVGFEEYVLLVKERLCAEKSELQFIPICGMGGISKTTLAKNVYNDPLAMVTFDIRVWVTVSQDYNAQRILSSFLDSLKEFDKGRLGNTNEEKVYKILKYRKYLVVMDDIWSCEAWDAVRAVFPDDNNGSRVVLTTRLYDVASYPDSSSKLCEIQLMDEDQSWDLFKQKVFANEDCPDELENTGKEIVRSCKGLPLAIVVIAGILSTTGKNLASWQEICENVKSIEHSEIEDILSLSYFQLPQYLRPCFLYMGSFPEDAEINVTKLIRLWIAEGFLKSPVDSNNFEKVAEEYLEELVKRNLVQVIKRKWDGRIKSCGLHDFMRDLCLRKSHESKFFLSFKAIRKESFIGSIQNQRSLSVDFSVYFKNTHTEMESLRESIVNQRRLFIESAITVSNSTIHSIKCWGFGVLKLGIPKLLRVLDSEYPCICESPLTELGKLYHLRYFSMRYSTYCTCIRNDISEFQNLQTLIIHGEKKPRFTDLWLVWCMPHLRHIYFPGTIFFAKETACSFISLQTVAYLSYQSCTRSIVKKIPNLKKLKVDCSGALFRGSLACLNNLVHLLRLENLEVHGGRWIHSRPKFYNLSLPKMLKKLKLTDLVLPWNDIVVVGSLPNLQVLKLKDCTCVGGTWETREGEFPQLEFLLIKDCMFENWVTESSHFPRLRCLLLHSCSNLSEIPIDIGVIPTLEVIEVNGEFKNSLMKSAREIQKEQEDSGNDTLQVVFKLPVLEDSILLRLGSEFREVNHGGLSFLKWQRLRLRFEF